MFRAVLRVPVMFVTGIVSLYLAVGIVVVFAMLVSAVLRPVGEAIDNRAALYVEKDRVSEAVARQGQPDPFYDHGAAIERARLVVAESR